MASSAAERYFTQVANDVLQATERLTQHLEENLSLLWGSSPSQTATDLPEDIDEDLLQMNPLQGMAENVLHGVFDQQAKPRTMMESLEAFRAAITWSEPFILSIIVFQMIMFMLTVYVAKFNPHLAPRLGIIVVIAIIVKGSEYLNQYGSDNWESFCTQNYFDAQGVFMSIMVCAPLLVYSFIMLCFYLRETSQLLIQFKRLQLKQQRRNQNAAAAAAAATGTPTSEESSAHRAKKDL